MTDRVVDAPSITGPEAMSRLADRLATLAPRHGFDVAQTRQREAVAPETHEALAKLHPVGRMGEVQDIVDAVMYLEMAGFVTGEILHVDGGQSAGH